MNEVRKRSVWEMATGILLAAFAVLIVLTFRNYGVTVDERHSNLNGRYFIEWYASGFRDRAIIDEGNQRLYGSFFNSLSAFIADHSRLAVNETGYLLNGITSTE